MADANEPFFAPTAPDAGDVEQLAGQRADHDAVMVAVGDEQPARLLIGQDLPRKLERRGGQLVAARAPV